MMKIKDSFLASTHTDSDSRLSLLCHSVTRFQFYLVLSRQLFATLLSRLFFSFFSILTRIKQDNDVEVY